MSNYRLNYKPSTTDFSPIASGTKKKFQPPDIDLDSMKQAELKAITPNESGATPTKIYSVDEKRVKALKKETLKRANQYLPQSFNGEKVFKK